MQYLNIGQVTNTHGVKGEVKVYPLTDSTERFKLLKWVFVGEEMSKYDIENVKMLKKFVVIKFKDINDVNTAEKLKGEFLRVDRENAIKLDEDEYFICDLIGCKVIDPEKNFEGILMNVIQTGSNDIYIVNDNNNKEILIPAIKNVIREVDICGKRIIVNIMDGLMDL